MSAVPLLHLAIALVTAHVWADFGASGASPQTQGSKVASPAARHAILYGLLSALLLPAWSPRALGVIAGLAVVRGVLYLWRARGLWPYARCSPLGGLALDQAARLAAIVVALAVLFPIAPSAWRPWRWVHEALGVWPDAAFVPGALALAAAYVWAVPGGSAIVRAVLAPFSAALPDEQGLSLGRVIGYLERLILLTLFLLHQYAAIGLIITAKSVIRIPSIRPPGGLDASPTAGVARTEAPGALGPGWAREKITGEYFLIGTLASIAIALFAGLLARWTLTLL